jgi:hypothetical protein
MRKKECKEVLDVYECYWYFQYGEQTSYWCKDYPNFCKNCPELEKIGERRVDSEKEGAQ